MPVHVEISLATTNESRTVMDELKAKHLPQGNLNPKAVLSEQIGYHPCSCYQVYGCRINPENCVPYSSVTNFRDSIYLHAILPNYAFPLTQ